MLVFTLFFYAQLTPTELTVDGERPAGSGIDCEEGRVVGAELDVSTAPVAANAIEGTAPA